MPSSTRAAPAKKRTWSIAGGSSSVLVNPSGLPVFSLSTATNSSARFSIASASLSSASWRSAGVESRQVSNAVDAALHRPVDVLGAGHGAVANSSSVDGLTMPDVRPSALSTYSPLMRFCSVRVVMQAPCAGREVEEDFTG